MLDRDKANAPNGFLTSDLTALSVRRRISLPLASSLSRKDYKKNGDMLRMGAAGGWLGERVGELESSSQVFNSQLMY